MERRGKKVEVVTNNKVQMIIHSSVVRLREEQKLEKNDWEKLKILKQNKIILLKAAEVKKQEDSRKEGEQREER